MCNDLSRFFKIYQEFIFKSANVEYTPHDGDVTCSARTSIKYGSVFLEEQKIFYKVMYFLFKSSLASLAENN